MTYSELILTKDTITYGDLLATAEWRAKRQEILSTDNCKCTNCNNNNIYFENDFVWYEYNFKNNVIEKLVCNCSNKSFKDKVKIEHKAKSKP